MKAVEDPTVSHFMIRFPLPVGSMLTTIEPKLAYYSNDQKKLSKL